MNVKLGNLLHGGKNGVCKNFVDIYLILNLMAAENYLKKIFMINGKKATVVPGGIGNE